MILHSSMAKPRKRKEKYCIAFDGKKEKTIVTSNRLKSCHELIKTSIFTSSVLPSYFIWWDLWLLKKNHKLGLLIYKCIWFWGKPSSDSKTIQIYWNCRCYYNLFGILNKFELFWSLKKVCLKIKCICKSANLIYDFFEKP